MKRRQVLHLSVGGVVGALYACGPLGTVGDVVSRERKDEERQALVSRIHRCWQEQDAERFRYLRASVSFSNDWQRMFATQYTLVVTGTVRDGRDRDIAIILAREVLGVDPRRVFVSDLMTIAK